MVGTTKVRDAVGRQHFAVFHHVNVASEKHEASSHIIIFSGKPCNLVLVPPIYAGRAAACVPAAAVPPDPQIQNGIVREGVWNFRLV